MSLTATPPRSGPEPPPTDTVARPSRPAVRQLRDRGYRRTVRIGLAISAAFHLVVLVLLARLLEIEIPAYERASQPLRPPQGIELVLLTEPGAAEPEQTAQPRETTRQEPPPEGRRPVPAPARPPSAEEGRRLTNAEKLQPREGDPRLWKDFSDRGGAEGRGGFSRADSAVRAIVSRMLDSLTEEQRRAAVEWLTEDGEWGVTPEGIRIGGVTIPISLGQLFAEEGPRGREARQEARDLGEIQRQDMLHDAEAVRKERLEEMRRRSREEAARREEAPPAEPDTVPPLVP